MSRRWFAVVRGDEMDRLEREGVPFVIVGYLRDLAASLIAFVFILWILSR